MRRANLEAKVLGIVDRVRQKQNVEDALVELKATWIEPKAAARRIAAACNAARGDDVLFVFGIDEEQGVRGASKEDLANWWPQVQAEFQQGSPSLIHDVAVPVDDLALVALLFDTSGAPFVVRNPVRGAPGCGPVELEVPWREGSRTRSARREDLLRILVPATAAPELEVLSGEASCYPNDRGSWSLKASIGLYVVPRGNTVLVAHRSTVDAEPSQFSFTEARYERYFEGPTVADVAVTEHDAVMSRPAKIDFLVSGTMSGGPTLPQSLVMRVCLAVVDAPSSPVAVVRMVQKRPPDGTVEYWIPPF